jgi:hypothetical protein
MRSEHSGWHEEPYSIRTVHRCLVYLSQLDAPKAHPRERHRNRTKITALMNTRWRQTSHRSIEVNTNTLHKVQTPPLRRLVRPPNRISLHTPAPPVNGNHPQMSPPPFGHSNGPELEVPSAPPTAYTGHQPHHTFSSRPSPLNHKEVPSTLANAHG